MSYLEELKAIPTFLHQEYGMRVVTGKDINKVKKIMLRIRDDKSIHPEDKYFAKDMIEVFLGNIRVHFRQHNFNKNRRLKDYTYELSFKDVYS